MYMVAGKPSTMLKCEPPHSCHVTSPGLQLGTLSWSVPNSHLPFVWCSTLALLPKAALHIDANATPTSNLTSR